MNTPPEIDRIFQLLDTMEEEDIIHLLESLLWTQPDLTNLSEEERLRYITKRFKNYYKRRIDASSTQI